MRAVFQTGYGSPDMFEVAEMAKPQLKKADDVLIRVHAAALHAGDVFMMRGVPYFTRMVVGFPKPRNYIPPAMIWPERSRLSDKMSRSSNQVTRSTARSTIRALRLFAHPNRNWSTSPPI